MTKDPVKPPQVDSAGRQDPALKAFLSGPKVHWAEGELQELLDEQYD